ncbi:MAG: twin arginine-targeting protein translocase TatB [Thermoplasmata archaeon M9B2D]|nr:MAG: twin arginine-targeting protein translocase TatB [Thermoplasmata archaeon M9B2D]
MFDLGMQELIVIFVVALIVFGPKKLPELGRTLGKGVAELKKALSGVKDQIDEEVKEVKEPLLEDKDRIDQANLEGSEEKKSEDKTVDG